MSSSCSPFISNCQPGQGTELQTSRPLPQYALLGFLFLFVMLVFIIVFLIRTRNLCLDARRQHGIRLGSNSSRLAGGGAAPATPAQPLTRQGQGLDPATIQALPLFSYKKGGIPESAGLKGLGDCSVCLCEYQEGESVRLLPGCRHLFHPDCVDMWLQFHTSCPLCRTNVQVKKQSSLRRVLSLLSGRYQVDDFSEDGMDGAMATVAPTQDAHALVLVIAPEVEPAAPSGISGHQASEAARGASSQTGQAPAAPPAAPTLSAPHSVPVPAYMAASASAETSQCEAHSSTLLGNCRSRRPASEDICWAVAEASLLDTITPRPVKRAASLGRDAVSVRQRPFFERRHSFTEMLRRSIGREPSLTRSLSRPSMDPLINVAAVGRFGDTVSPRPSSP